MLQVAALLVEDYVKKIEKWDVQNMSYGLC